VTRDDERYHPAGPGQTAGGLVEDLTPPPPATPLTVREPARDVPVHAVTDVLVVGGGPAGCAAALAARRLGAEVLLVERYNHLGGLSTGGLVIWIDRMTDWSGREVIAGFASEILERLPAGAVAGAPRDQWGSTDEEAVGYWRERQGAFRDVVTWSPIVDPEWLKVASATILAEAGVRFLLHSWVVGALTEGRHVRGVTFESKEGRRAILARTIVDATGDLDVARRAGAGVELDGEEGSEGDGAASIQHCLNTAWTWAGVDFDRWVAFKREDPSAHRALMSRAREALGFVERPVAGWRPDVVVFMGPRLSGYSGLSTADLTKVEFESRRRMIAHLEHFRRNAPGFENAWLLLSASQIGVRHTGSVVGLHRMVADDWKRGVRHADEVGVSPSPSQKFANVSVPYGALVPRDLDNLLVGGRHIATDGQTQAFMREIPQCWLTGQAAGAAAAIAAQADAPAAAIDVSRLQDELRRQGVHLQQRDRPSAAVVTAHRGARAGSAG
jgi:2-polyprenyl-6-methoxyphenol hydroxylase-like FAD-dependent oxidoreductase